MVNHIAENIISRGNMNISALTKGFILPEFKYKIIRRHGGISTGEGYDQLVKDLSKDKKDVDVIEVYVDWYKDGNKHGKYIYARLIEKKIEAQLIKDVKIKYKITVKLIN